MSLATGRRVGLGAKRVVDRIVGQTLRHGKGDRDRCRRDRPVLRRTTARGRLTASTCSPATCRWRPPRRWRRRSGIPTAPSRSSGSRRGRRRRSWRWSGSRATNAPASAMRTGTELHRRHMPDPWWVQRRPDAVAGHSVPRAYVDGWTFTRAGVEMPVYLHWLSRRVEALGGTLTRMALNALPGRGRRRGRRRRHRARRPADGGRQLAVAGARVRWFCRAGRAWRSGGWTPADPGLSMSCRAAATSSSVAPTTRGSGTAGSTPTSRSRSSPGPSRWCPTLAGARVSGHKVGLRPARPSVRLEAEERGSTRIVHCYGHGGAGVTFSWGCAEDVVALVEA